MALSDARAGARAGATCSSTSRPTRPSRWSAASLFAALGGPALLETQPAASTSCSSSRLFLAMNVLNFLLIALDFAVVEGRADRRRLPARLRAGAARRVRHGPAHRRRRLRLPGPQPRASSASSPSSASSSSTCCGRRSTRWSARSSSRAARGELAVAPGRPARHGAADALAARQDDRAPLGRGRPLLARDRPRAGSQRARAGRRPHRRAAARHRQVHLPGLDPLRRSTRLSPEDLEIVRRHPEQGARLVARIDGYGPVAEIILAHHERIDGGGYPNGLAGEQIPLAARIISVADTYDVMTARDSYRRPVSSREAIAELRRVSGASSTRASSRRSSGCWSSAPSRSATPTTPTSSASSTSSAGPRLRGCRASPPPSRHDRLDSGTSGSDPARDVFVPFARACRQLAAAATDVVRPLPCALTSASRGLVLSVTPAAGLRAEDDCPMQMFPSTCR